MGWVCRGNLGVGVGVWEVGVGWKGDEVAPATPPSPFAALSLLLLPLLHATAAATATSTRFKSPQLVQSRPKPCGTRHGSEVTPGGVMSVQQPLNFSHSVRHTHFWSVHGLHLKSRMPCERWIEKSLMQEYTCLDGETPVWMLIVLSKSLQLNCQDASRKLRFQELFFGGACECVRTCVRRWR